MTKFRNIIVVALILVIGIGIVVTGGITIKFNDSVSMNLSGVFVATIVGIVVNAILPKVKNEVRNMGSEEDIAAAKIAYGEVDETNPDPQPVGEVAEGSAADGLPVAGGEERAETSATETDKTGTK